MLTVKHIEVTGEEVLYPAMKVTYKPAYQSDLGLTGTAACVFIENLKGEQVALGSWGRFFVMNDIGKTVAKYDLGGWNETTTQAEGSLATGQFRITRSPDGAMTATTVR